MIWRRTVLCLGLSQLVCWGISYYLIGGFGDLIAADLGWSQTLVYGGFTAALIVMGLTSPVTGHLIDRHGGRRVMVTGSLALAVGCTALALSRTVLSYYTAWAWMGLAMRLTLYEAAFASVARIGGPGARRPIAQITLLGGLASTVFWPIGNALAGPFGWRGAVMAYAGFALLTIPLHLAIPNTRYGEAVDGETAAQPLPPAHPPLAAGPRDRLIAGSLYAVIVTLAGFLNSGMSAHMIALLAGFGLAASVSVWISTLRGIGQSLARVCEVLFGARLHPLTLNVLATLVLPFCFAAGLLSGQFVLAAIGFAFFYGAGNGIVTITRGTLPLVLFGHRSYGAITGRLLVPSFLLSAVAPIAYAFVIERFGDGGALYLSIALSSVAFGAAIALKLIFGEPRPA
ncbi:MAG TPA: MFS transporter [Stellaceae bacterium]|nr:MFS transporter [Stellaceae bacterium]